IDISTPTGKLLVTVLSALCQFERDLTVQRTNEGLTAARARGRKGGRPPADKKAIEQALKMYDTKAFSVAKICEVCGISQGTLYKAKNERNNEKENENE
ncbi:MAG: recombinase family protein, partial [Oscillospiraceae bacterium]